MLKTIPKAWLLAGLLFAPWQVHAAGFGKLTVISALGQPLNAEIDIVSLAPNELDGLGAKVASVDEFRQAGIEYSETFSRLSFTMANRPSGQAYLKISSTQPIDSPFLDLLLELDWKSGKVVREYTILLDPVEYQQAQTPSVAAPKVAIPATELPQVEPQAGTAQTTGTHGPVKRGETLSKIALEAKPDEVSLDQMLVALYQSNEDAFMGHNMNRLKTGKILQIPDEKQVEAIDRSEARKVVSLHAANWGAYRQKLAAIAAETPSGARQSATGKIATAVADRAAPAMGHEEVLKLSKGEGSAAEQEIAKQKALVESSERVVELESNIKEMNRLLELKKQALASAQAGAASAPPAVVASAAPAVAASAAKPAKLKMVMAPKPEPTFLETLLDNQPLLAAAASALLGLSALGLFLSRRKKKAVAEEFVSKPEPVFTEPKRAEEAFNPDEVNPIEEAELYLSYGRHAHAENILREALQRNPRYFEAHLLLLKILASRHEAEGFEMAARKFKGAGAPEYLWAQACSMGFAIDPQNSLYAGAAAGAETGFAEAGKSDLDFDLDFGAEAAAESDVDMEIAEEPGTKALQKPEEETHIDFDITSMNEIFPEAAAEEAETAVDFDITSMHEAFPEAAVEAETKLDFDITSMHEALKAEEAAAEAPFSMDFDIPVLAPEPEAEVTPEAAPASEPEISFDLELPEEAEVAAESEALAEPEEVAEPEISFDLEMPAEPEIETEPEVAAEPEISFDLEMPSEPEEAAEPAPEPEISFDLELPAEEEIAAEPAAESEVSFDLDIPAEPELPAADEALPAAGEETVMDFDMSEFLTTIGEVEPAAAAGDMADVEAQALAAEAEAAAGPVAETRAQETGAAEKSAQEAGAAADALFEQAAAEDALFGQAAAEDAALEQAAAEDAAFEHAVAEQAAAAIEDVAFDLSDIPSLGGAAVKSDTLADIDLDLGEEPKKSAEERPANWYEVATKLDLAKVYQEMGDMEGAREILDEVLQEGDEAQQATAKAILESLA